MTTRVEVLRKQRFARSNGVGRVGNDDFEATVGFGYKLQSIINDQAELENHQRRQRSGLEGTPGIG